MDLARIDIFAFVTMGSDILEISSTWKEHVLENLESS
jgi:hypothetical protein